MAGIANETLSLLKTALTWFECVQIARSFEKNFDAHQIKLDIIQLRLSRWGEAAGIDATKQSGETALAISNHERANALLEQIDHLFQQAKEDAEKLRPKDTSAAQGEMDPDKDMKPLMKTLRKNLRNSLSRRCAQLTNWTRSMQWAFYKKEQFEEFVGEISGLVSQLEALFPKEEATDTRLHELSAGDCTDIDRTYLKELKKIATECDPWLDRAVDIALKDTAPSGAGTNISFTNRDNYGPQTGIQNGDMNGGTFGHTVTSNHTWN